MIFTESAKMKLDLEALNIFVQIVESGSISGAAQRLDMPVSAVSRSLSRLEQHLGLTLLQRSTRRMEITAPGFCDEKIYLYQAEGVRAGSTLQNDEDEFTETVLLGREAIRAALQNGEIVDAKTLIGLQYWLLNS